MKKIIIALGFVGFFAGSTSLVFAGYFDTTPIQRCNTQITHTLQIGSENDDVYVLQSMLKQGGYLYVTPNGYFGVSTKSAVMRFQNENGLSASGIVGELTRNAVNERLCDNDVRGDTTNYMSYEYNGYTSGTTYVDPYDPYVKVISPQITNPVVYATPQEYSNNSSFSLPSVNATYVTNTASNYLPSTGILTPATSQIEGSHIIYNPSTGYSYGLTQKSASLTVITPVSNSVFNEGDTVNLAWTTDNLNASGFEIILENTSTGQSKQIAVVQNNSFSFVLSKELLDAVCAGGCDNNQQGSFKIVIMTPVTDIAGITSNFRAGVSPITIKRPYGINAPISILTGKTPVNSGEKFKLYVQAPITNNPVYNNYTIKIHALCPSSVSVKVAGVSCGQDFVAPLSLLSTQQEIPAEIVNNSWFKQDVTFEVMVINPAGQVVGVDHTIVTANSAPIVW
jgi:peptidoglycan hydrolase-like protein with peptidoglycan-binding domain